MFTGIIESKIEIDKITTAKSGVDVRIFFAVPLLWRGQLKHGQSIAVNGCCLTVAEIINDHIVFDVSSETLAKTNLGELKPGSSVNLERAMQVGDRLDGHMVSGHVETTASLVGIEAGADCTLWKVDIDKRFAPLLIQKGSICLDGVSLTINRLTDFEDRVAIELMLIPTTLDLTTFSDKRVGQRLNVEFDLVGKYLLRFRECLG